MQRNAIISKDVEVYEKSTDASHVTAAGSNIQPRRKTSKIYAVKPPTRQRNSPKEQHGWFCVGYARSQLFGAWVWNASVSADKSIFSYERKVYNKETKKKTMNKYLRQEGQNITFAIFGAVWENDAQNWRHITVLKCSKLTPGLDKWSWTAEQR